MTGKIRTTFARKLENALQDTNMSFARVTLRSLSRARPTFAVSKQSAYRLHRANFSAAAGPSREDIQSRIFNVLKSFEKVEPSKVPFSMHTAIFFLCSCRHIFQISTSASFANDLSLDSLDAVEVVMAIEEVRVFLSSNNTILTCLAQEFAIEIPDAEADEIKTVQQGRSPVLPIDLSTRNYSFFFALGQPSTISKKHLKVRQLRFLRFTSLTLL